ncbi:UPF0598 protein CG30010 [Bombyx mandarina]|uniref:UPF0598 protein CG30010 n=1 Tax=Bombyx mandarina TaxID=7092 RepID=A0A6J2KQV6_BOMMA|nr:UPF0598 protein CG30010 [Bombyx mandarina]
MMQRNMIKIAKITDIIPQICSQKKSLHYVQGQEPEPKIREYFYYIDHQGMLFLDDARIKNFTSCFKEKKFLEFFFKRIRLNKTGKYEAEFPFVSHCGRERNYIRCDDLPIVFTHIFHEDNVDFLSYGYAGDLLRTVFIPDKVYMLPLTGRVYHVAEEKFGGVGLIKSKLAIELSKYFEFHNGDMRPPTHLTWHNKKYELDLNWFDENVKRFNLKINSVGN